MNETAKDMERAYSRDPRWHPTRRAGVCAKLSVQCSLKRKFAPIPTSAPTGLWRAGGSLASTAKNCNATGISGAHGKCSSAWHAWRKAFSATPRWNPSCVGASKSLASGFEIGRQLSHDLVSSVGIEMGRCRDLGMSR